MPKRRKRKDTVTVVYSKDLESVIYVTRDSPKQVREDLKNDLREEHGISRIQAHTQVMKYYVIESVDVD